MRFSLTRRQRGDRAVRLGPAGEVDVRSAGALRAAIQDTLRTSHVSAVVVDLGEVTFLDCAGIGALVAGRNTAVSQRRGYSVINPQRHVRRVLDLTGVLTALVHQPEPTQPTRQAARSNALPAPRKRGAGGSQRAGNVNGSGVRVPTEWGLVMEKWPLAALADGLLSHALNASSRRGTRTIHGGLPPDLLRQTVIALACGQRLDHPNEGAATVQVLRGRVRMTAGGETTEAPAGQLLILSDERHTVTALEDAVLLHTVGQQPAMTVDPAA